MDLIQKSKQGRTILLAAALLTSGGAASTYAQALPAQKEVSERHETAAKKPVLGVKVQDVDRDTADALGLADAKGALIVDILSGGPADKGGLKPTDAILSVNGKAISDAKDLARQIAELSPKSSVDIAIRRGESKQNLKIELGEAAGGAPAESDTKESSAEPETLQLGLSLANSSSAEGAVISSVDPDSDAAAKGLKSGDVIVQVDGAPAQSAEAAVESVSRIKKMGRDAVLLQIRSGNQLRTVAVRFSSVG